MQPFTANDLGLFDPLGWTDELDTAAIGLRADLDYALLPDLIRVRAEMAVALNRRDPRDLSRAITMLERIQQRIAQSIRNTVAVADTACSDCGVHLARKDYETDGEEGWIVRADKPICNQCLDVEKTSAIAAMKGAAE